MYVVVFGTTDLCEIVSLLLYDSCLRFAMPPPEVFLLFIEILLSSPLWTRKNVTHPRTKSTLLCFLFVENIGDDFRGCIVLLGCFMWVESQKKNKRAREDNEVEIESSFVDNNNAKKRDSYGISFSKEKKEVEDKGCLNAWNSHLALGVFDFPWLKDGVISKSEDCFLYLEDNFMSSLEPQDTSFEASSIEICEEHGLCETIEESIAHIPELKLMEDVLQPFESNGLELEVEDVDCIWSFVLNKPL
ncbi:hypothetical protein VNO77_25408 [Canavalia gladiata]|uniref:Uncharacterized protein n=1 Tax=Canavalia gladiata TaxID=3824 RepID=A0AAN9QAW1_CANGL